MKIWEKWNGIVRNASAKDRSQAQFEWENAPSPKRQRLDVETLTRAPCNANGIRRKHDEHAAKFAGKRMKVIAKFAGNMQVWRTYEDLHQPISRKIKSVQKLAWRISMCRSSITQHESIIKSTRNTKTCTDRSEEDSTSKLQITISHSILHGFQWFKAQHHQCS